MTPLSSVAILEKLALLKMAFCKAPAFSRTSLRRTSVTISTARGSPSKIAFWSIIVTFWSGLLRDASSAQVMLEAGDDFRQDDRLRQKWKTPESPTTRRNFPFRDRRRQKYNRHGFQFCIRLETSGQCPAVHTRHHHIQQD